MHLKQEQAERSCQTRSGGVHGNYNFGQNKREEKRIPLFRNHSLYRAAASKYGSDDGRSTDDVIHVIS